MDRRGFLSWLGGTAAGVAASATLDVERLLWVPGEKTIFLPNVEVFSDFDVDYSDLVFPDWVTSEALAVLRDNLRLSSMVNREYSHVYNRDAMHYTVNLPKRWAPSDA